MAEAPSTLTDRSSFYIGALLHDIGKFIERARLEPWQDRAKGYVRRGEASSNHAHRRYSAAFIRAFTEEKAFLTPAAETLALWHHRGREPDKDDAVPIDERGVSLKLLRIADDCASAERARDDALEPVSYRRARLASPFVEIAMGGQALSEATYVDLNALSRRREALFPAGTEPTMETNRYAPLVEAFLDDVRKVDSEAALYSLLEKYLHAVPAQTPVSIDGQDVLYRPDINLFDHSRTVAALALCLYDEYARGAWRGHEDLILSDRYATLPAPCLLVSGDLSGIQRFIFDIPSSGAARALKGRSFAVQLAAEACVDRLCRALDLKAASVLYNGGGNFFLLAPACREADLEAAQRALSEDLLGADLYLALGWTPVSISDFQEQRFAARWRDAYDAVARRKRRRFQELDAKRVFAPVPQAVRSDAEREAYRRRTDALAQADAYRLSPAAGEQAGATEGPRLLEEALGYAATFTGEDRRSTAFNTTDVAGRYRGFRYSVKDLPRYDASLAARFTGGAAEDAAVRPGTVVQFDHLARLAEDRTGTAKLGILKMDVDNLGQLFVGGLPPPLRSIARVAALSRAMQWFFEAYMNTLLVDHTFSWLGPDGHEHETPFAQQLYPIFAGGDDVFVVGAWDAIFAFARRVRREFEAFVGGHPAITLSAGLLVRGAHAPVSRFADEAEERLEDAKDKDERKDKVSVFGHVLTWDEFEEAAALKRRLEVLVKRHGESRALIQRVQRSTRGYGALQEQALHGTLRPVKLWRLAYYLTRNVQDANLAEVQALAQTHQALLMETYSDPTRARTPALFTVAARWAELSSRQLPTTEPEPAIS